MKFSAWILVVITSSAACTGHHPGLIPTMRTQYRRARRASCRDLSADHPASATFDLADLIEGERVIDLGSGSGMELRRRPAG